MPCAVYVAVMKTTFNKVGGNSFGGCLRSLLRFCGVDSLTNAYLVFSVSKKNYKQT